MSKFKAKEKEPVGIEPLIQEDEVDGNIAEPVNLTHTALGIFTDSLTGASMIARIKYDPVTGKTGNLEKVDSGGIGKSFANEKFKIMAIQEVGVGNG